MKTAHLILAHKNPAQLQRLIEALDHPAFDYYIHLDKKSDLSLFAHLEKWPRVHFIRERVSIYWAGYGTIQATLNGFRELVPLHYDYINVISAQDFPIKSAPHIYQYLETRKGTEFITCESVFREWPEAAIRVQQYQLANIRIPGRHKIEKLINLFLPRRKFPLDYEIVGRANWFTLTGAAAVYLLDFVQAHPEIPRFFKLSWGADEIFFATILYNSPFRSRIADNLVYVD